MENDGERMIAFEPTRREIRVLDTEINRIQAELGVTVSRQDIIRALIELHRARLQMLAQEQPHSIIGGVWVRTWLDD